MSERWSVGVICGLLACVASCGAAPTVPPQVVVQTPPVEPAPAPAPPADEVVIGRWTEHFDTRSGCADVIEISRRGTTLAASGANCNNGEAYIFESVSFEGTELHISVKGTTGFSIEYRLKLMRPGVLFGESIVAGGETYKVSWTKEP